MDVVCTRVRSTRRVHRFELWCLSWLLAGEGLLAQPVISAVVNAASYEASLAPGCWMAIFGSRLAPETAVAPAPEPLPTRLSGVSVTVDGVPAPLAFVSPGQINALMPFEIQVAGEKWSTVMVSTGEGTSGAHRVWLKETAPALFTRDQSGRGRVIAIAPQFDRLLDSIQPGEPFILYAAGLGQTDPPAQSDRGGRSSEPLNRVPGSRMPRVLVGDRPAEILFAGLAPGWPGVYQLNVRAPASLESERVLLQVQGAQSNITSLDIRAGENVRNVSGSLASLFPPDGSDPGFPPDGYPFDRSVMPQVTRFSVSLEVAPGARPFTILATGEAGYARIEVDPPNGRWQATLSVFDPAIVQGDYASTGRIYDYMMCDFRNNPPCSPFPLSIVPRSRLFPSEVRAFLALPLPTSPPSGGMGTFTASGNIPTSGRFVIDQATNSSLATFGGLVQIPLGYLDSRVAPLRLYVDGRLIAAKDVPYKVRTRP